MKDLIYYLYKNQVNLFNVMPSILAKVDLSNYFNCNYIYSVLPIVFLGRVWFVKYLGNDLANIQTVGKGLNCRQRVNCRQRFQLSA